jgi:hypothetical protein
MNWLKSLRFWLQRTRLEVIDSMRIDSTFMGQLSRGEVAENSIDNFIEDWHVNSPARGHVGLDAFLGMTREEYASFLELRKTPLEILEARHA